MRTIIRSGIAALGLAVVGGAAPALAQDAAPVTAGTVVHDTNGSILGTLVRLADGGRTAVVETPAHFFPGSRLVGSDQLRLPLASVAEAGGRPTVRSATAEPARVRRGVN